MRHAVPQNLAQHIEVAVVRGWGASSNTCFITPQLDRWSLTNPCQLIKIVKLCPLNLDHQGVDFLR